MNFKSGVVQPRGILRAIAVSGGATIDLLQGEVVMCISKGEEREHIMYALLEL
jgi:hypothetical protein